MESKYMDEDDILDEEEEDILDEEEDDMDIMDGGAPKKRIVVKTAKNEDDDEDIDDDDDDEMDDIEDENELLDDDEYNDNDETNAESILTSIKKNEMKQNFPNLDGSDYDDDDEDEDDENDLQKFEENMQQNVIAEYHPEMRAYNYDEVETLTRVVRDENGTIIDPLHRTLPFITRYEKARVLGERAKQLNAGAKPFVEIDESVIDGYLIALKEFEAKAIPFIVQRPLPGGGVEMWKLKDLEIL
jgi:DNA-directed RNA polymerase I, II, and III subunit RPABC2